MITTLLFDFGDVFINLDKNATFDSFYKLGFTEENIPSTSFYENYEIGNIPTDQFIDKHQNAIPDISRNDIVNGWNAILKDFPYQRLQFLEKIKKEKRFRLLLLSNTNELHIDWIKENITFYDKFKACFEGFYLSHEIGKRKPNTDVFEFILRTHHLKPEELLFVDDTKANTDAAESLGIHIWNNDPIKQDITELFKIKSSLF